jgi:hypothetical protein
LVDDERQPIFESVCRARHWPRQAPYDDFDENSGIQHVPFIDQQLSLHVGRNNNIQVVLSMTPTTRERADVYCIYLESPVGSVLRPRSAGEILATGTSGPTSKKPRLGAPMRVTFSAGRRRLPFNPAGDRHAPIYDASAYDRRAWAHMWFNLVD